MIEYTILEIPKPEPKLTKEAFMENMNKLLAVFPNWNVKLEEKAVARVWYDLFKYQSDCEFENMIGEYIRKETGYPTIAGLKKHYSRSGTDEVPMHKRSFIPEEHQ